MIALSSYSCRHIFVNDVQYDVVPEGHHPPCTLTVHEIDNASSGIGGLAVANDVTMPIDHTP